MVSQGDSRAPLVFSAAKVAFGHTEPAAGAAGLCSAMLRCANEPSKWSTILGQQAALKHARQHVAKC